MRLIIENILKNNNRSHLHQLPRMSLMEQIVDAVRVHAYPSRCLSAFRLLVCDANAVVGASPFAYGVRFVAVRRLFADRLLAEKKKTCEKQ